MENNEIDKIEIIKTKIDNKEISLDDLSLEELEDVQELYKYEVVDLYKKVEQAKNGYEELLSNNEE